MAWDANLHVLQSCHPQAYAALINTPVQAESRSQEELRPAALPIPGRPVDAQRERVVLVFGAGTGAWLRQRLASMGERLRLLVVLEPDPAHLRALFEQENCTDWLGHIKLRLIAGPDWPALNALLNEVHPVLGVFGATAWEDGFCAARFAQERTTFLQCAHRHALSAWVNRYAINERGLQFQLNIAGNLKNLPRSVGFAALKESVAGCPALVIGAGPSLQPELATLRDAPPGVLLIAADTAFRVLQARGIQPHIVVTCDPTSLNRRHFAGYESLAPSLLAYLPESDPATIGRLAPTTPTLFLYTGESRLVKHLVNTKAPEKLDQGSNVGYCAFSLAIALGCSPIMLVGMDLSFRPGGLSHVEGSANASKLVFEDEGDSLRFSENVETGKNKVVRWPGYSGGEVATLAHFAQIIMQIEERIAQESLLVIDASVGGAHKHGAVKMPLASALSQNPGTGSPWHALNNLSPQPDPETLHKMQANIQQLCGQLRQSEAHLQRGVAAVAQWKEKCLSAGSASLAARKQEADAFRQQLLHITTTPPLTEALDVGLAKVKYELERFEDPQDATPEAWAEAWAQNLTRWMEGVKGSIRRLLLVLSQSDPGG